MHLNPTEIRISTNTSTYGIVVTNLNNNHSKTTCKLGNFSSKVLYYILSSNNHVHIHEVLEVIHLQLLT